MFINLTRVPNDQHMHTIAVFTHSAKSVRPMIVDRALAYHQKMKLVRIHRRQRRSTRKKHDEYYVSHCSDCWYFDALDKETISLENTDRSHGRRQGMAGGVT